MTIKKIMAMLLALSLCLALVACDSSDYKKAEELYATGDYSAALEIYTALGEYEDSQSKVKLCKFNIANTHFENKEYKAALEIYTELGEYEDAKDKAAYCEREVGMTENADYSFLADIEKSVLGRMNAPDGTAHSQLVNTELAYLEKYEDKTFYNEDLKEIADKYIEGLHVQKESMDKEIYCEEQIEWQRGLVLRYEALNELYKKYDFLTENAEFIGTYIASLEDQQYVLNGYYAIEDDIGAQTSAEDFTWWLDDEDYSFYCTLTNNTKYTFGTYFEFGFIDADGVVFETNTAYIDNITPGMTYVVEVYISDPDRLEQFTWFNYYDYID